MTIVSVVRDFEMYDRLVRNNPFNRGATFYPVDNREKNEGVSVGYNRFLNQVDYTQEDWFVFCHEDWEIQEDWMARVDKLPKKSLYGPVGARVVGRKKIVLGRIKNSTKDGSGIRWVGNHFRTGGITGTFDCQCLIVHSSLIRRTGLRFDPKLLFDFYVEEFCIHARERYGVLSRIIDLPCQHYSFGNIHSRFFDAVEYVREKYPVPKVCYSSTAKTVFIGTPHFFDFLFLEKELLMLLFSRYICYSKVTQSNHRLIKIFNLPIYHVKVSEGQLRENI